MTNNNDEYDIQNKRHLTIDDIESIARFSQFPSDYQIKNGDKGNKNSVQSKHQLNNQIS